MYCTVIPYMSMYVQLLTYSYNYDGSILMNNMYGLYNI